MKTDTATEPRLPAKLIRPQHQDVFPRSRLYERLDAATKHRYTWIAAPAGSGKTVLTSGYLDEREIPHLWYQVDKGDSDPATFFHYLSLAAQKSAATRSASLPALTPEYLSDLETFARRFFEALGQMLPLYAVLVLDNYQEAPAASLFHEILCCADATLPPGINLIVLSRAEPPSLFARSRLHGDLTVFGYDELRLTLDEAQGIACARKSTVAPDFIVRCHGEAQGWTAGFVLLLEQTQANPDENFRMDKSAHSLLFDYFAEEIFGRLPATIQMALPETAVLPKMTLSWLESLTGYPEAPKWLEDMHKRGYFVLRREKPETVYEYHPLFRDFLLAKIQKALPCEKYSQLLVRAADILVMANQAEDALPLYLEAHDYSMLATIIQKLAGTMLNQGRHRTLTQWLSAMPEQLFLQESWLLYWRGMARQPFDLAGAKRDFELSYERLASSNDAVRLYACWIAIAETYHVEWHDFQPFGYWLAEFERLRRQFPEFPSQEIEIGAHMIIAPLTDHAPDHPRLPGLVDRGMELFFGPGPDVHRLVLGSYLLEHFTFMGDLKRGRQIVSSLRLLLQAPGISVAAGLQARFWISFFYSVQGDFELARIIAQEGLSIADQTEIHLMDLLLHCALVYVGVVTGDAGFASVHLVLMRESIMVTTHMTGASYHHVAAMEALLRGDTLGGKEHAIANVDYAKQAGFPFAEALGHLLFATASLRQGSEDQQRIWLEIDQAQKIADSMNSRTLQYLCSLAAAEFSFGEQRLLDAYAFLQKAVLISREASGLVWSIWGPEHMANLYANALKYGIDREYVQGLIRRLGLVPPNPMATPESWPWPLEIRTMGGFEVIKDGMPLRSKGRLQQKPLELLLALIAFGGREVSSMQLADALWPDAEGDAAYRALVTNVQRARKLLGYPEAVQFNDGLLSLDTSRVWVDVRALECMLHHLEDTLLRNTSDQWSALRDRLPRLYRGPFLDRIDAAWAMPLRERLRARYASGISEFGHALEGSNFEKEAADLYHKSIEADPSIELFHQNLIMLRLKQGQVGEARAAYDYCRHIFHSRYGKVPSQETQDLIRPYLL